MLARKIKHSNDQTVIPWLVMLLTCVLLLISSWQGDVSAAPTDPALAPETTLQHKQPIDAPMDSTKGKVTAHQMDSLTTKKNASMTLTLRDMEINEAMEMLSKKDRVNIVLGKGVNGKVNVNLFDVTLDEAIRSVANAAGFSAELRNETYFIAAKEALGKNRQDITMISKAFKIEYTKPSVAAGALKNYLSAYGVLTLLEARKLVLVEDMPPYIQRMEDILKAIDHKPAQILIEAKILEVTLDDSESFGLDWSRLFRANRGSGNVGLRGLSSPLSPGFFFDFVNPNVEVFLDTLKNQGRVRTLSTPKLLAMENQEASVVIGDRIGYKVTTTVNQVTTESIEFLESGVILKVTPSVDGQRRVLLKIHPEISTGTISDGIPSQTTTEVTTQLLVPNTKTIFLGGLIKHSVAERRRGVPFLSNIPGLRWLFSNQEMINVNTETIVLITPRIVEQGLVEGNAPSIDTIQEMEQSQKRTTNKINFEINKFIDSSDNQWESDELF